MQSEATRSNQKQSEAIRRVLYLPFQGRRALLREEARARQGRVLRGSVARPVRVEGGGPAPGHPQRVRHRQERSVRYCNSYLGRGEQGQHLCERLGEVTAGLINGKPAAHLIDVHDAPVARAAARDVDTPRRLLPLALLLRKQLRAEHERSHVGHVAP